MPRPGSSPAGQWLEPAEAGERAWTGRVAARDSHGHYSVALSAQPGRLPLHVSPVRARPGNGLRCRQRHSNVCRSASCLASDKNIPHDCHLKMLLCSRAVAASPGSGLRLRRRPNCGICHEFRIGFRIVTCLSISRQIRLAVMLVPVIRRSTGQAKTRQTRFRC